MENADQQILKSELRDRFRLASRDYINVDVNKSIVNHVRQLIPLQTKIGAYVALSDEPNLSELFPFFKGQLALPKIEGQDLAFYYPQTDVSLQIGPMGVQEPDPSQSKKAELSELEALLIPGVAFDKKSQRLGRGKGYYDRLLKNYKGLKIGIASAVQISQMDLPVENHDVKVDIVVTDRFIMRRFDS